MVSTTQVAKHAGVSQTTVSRVLNRPEQVKKETYDKVMQALTELDYGNMAPIQEAKAERREVVALFSENCAAGSFEALRALTEQAQAFGYGVHGRALTGNEAEADLRSFATEGAALIAIGELSNEVKELLSEMGAVFLETGELDDKAPIDNRKAAYLATSHLAEKQHQQIGWVGFEQEKSAESLQGYYEALAHHQLKMRKKRIHTPQDSADFEEIVAGLRSFKKPTSAFVAATHEDGLQLYDALQSAGYKVPKDVSLIVIGEPEERGDAALTAVKPVQSAKPKIQQLMEELMGRLNNENAESVETAGEFVIDNQKTVKSYKEKRKK